MKRKYHYILSIFIILTLVGLPKSVWANTQANINAKNAQIQQLERQIQAIQNTKNQTTQQKSAKESEVTNLRNQVNQLNKDISSLQNQLNQVGQQITETENNIQSTTQSIQDLEQKIDENKATLQGLVENLYKQSHVKNEIVAVVSADNLSEVFNAVKYSDTIQNRIQALLTEVMDKKAALDVENQNLSNQKATLASTQGTLEDRKESIESSKNQVQSQAQASAVAVNQLNASLNNLNSRQQELEKQRRATAVELANLEASLSRQFGGEGRVCSARGYAWPVQGGRITQGFGMTPFARTGAYGGAGHNGIDIGAPTGTPVFATASGTVVSVGFNNNSYGKWIVIRHDDGYFSLYGHLSAQSVSNGQSVTRGQRIGSIGATGFATGPHLHFTIYLPNSLRIGSSPQGAPVNPSSCGY